MTLFLLAEVLGQTNKRLRTTTLSALANAENLNGGSYKGDRYDDLEYDDINEYLQARKPNSRGATTRVGSRWSCRSTRSSARRCGPTSSTPTDA